MEVRWTATFPEGTTLDEVRTFFATSDMTKATLLDRTTSESVNAPKGTARCGQYDLVVASAQPARAAPADFCRCRSEWSEKVCQGVESMPPPGMDEDAEAEDDAAEPAVKWFHKQADCSFRHWHGLRVPAELCHVCRPGADCGGAFSVTVKARKGPSLLPKFRRLAWRALVFRRLLGTFRSFSPAAAEDAILATYDPVARTWRETAVRVQMEREPFGKGGMRMAYRAKILKATDSPAEEVDWATAFMCVAKAFLNPEEDQEKCTRDVQQQMLAKHYAQLFNQQRPPQTIDFLQAGYIKLVQRQPKQLMAVEAFVEGHFKKWNNNTGGVLSAQITPQAFSHFTYERSGGAHIVVDIQGVDELYTDPQIHSLKYEFGPGDLGVAGMALFFQSHDCNPICKFLGLQQFSLYQKSKATGVVPSAPAPAPDGAAAPPRTPPGCSPREEGPGRSRKVADIFREVSQLETRDAAHRKSLASCFKSYTDPERKLLRRMTSCVQRNPSGLRAPDQVFEREHFPLFIDVDVSKIPKKETTEAQIHFQLARYHFMGRFSETREPSYTAALYHYQMAAQMGSVPGLLALAKLYSHSTYHDDVLPNQFQLEDQIQAAALLRAAAERGNADAAVSLATSFHHGTFTSVDYGQAVEWYRRYVVLREEKPGDGLEPGLSFGWEEHGVLRCHALKAVADLLAEGGPGLKPDLRQAYDLYGEAAELFMVSMKAKLANECYEKQAMLEADIDFSDDEAS